MAWSGFHRLSHLERLRRVAAHVGLTEEEEAILTARSALPYEQADAFIENAVGTFPMPLGFAVGFVIDGREVVVPMAIEESSVVAAASHGAKLAAAGGGFTTEAEPPVMVGQVELRGIPDLAAAAKVVEDRASEWMAALDAHAPRMAQRGGGMRAIEPRPVGERLVVHLHVDTQDAMGANTVNTLAEVAAPWLEEATGGTAGLRILTNLPDGRLVRASCRIPADTLGGRDVAEGIVAAQAFAEADPYRAVTHNKGVMNGIDAILVATGNDWRAVEAGAHAWACRSGVYGPLTRYALEDGHLVAQIELPLPVGTVGGVTRLHPVARACLRIVGVQHATELARVAAAVGLAQNLAALRALSREGIQRGHMALHARNLARQAGLRGQVADDVARCMVEEGTVSMARAQELAASPPQRS